MPLALFGSKENALVFERNLRSIIFFGHSQSFPLKMAMKNVRIRGRSYLKPIAESINKTNLLAKLHVWLIKVYIFAALKCVFYIVNSNYSRKFLFYDKRVWQRVYQKKLNDIPKKLLRVYKNSYVSDITKKQNVYLLKVLPKRRGSRPIYVKWKTE